MWTMFSVCTVSIFYYALPTFYEVQRKYLAVEGNSYASVLACDWLTRNGLGVFRGCQVILFQTITSMSVVLKKNTGFSYKLLICLFSGVCYIFLGGCCSYLLQWFRLVLFTSTDNVFGNMLVFPLLWGKKMFTFNTSVKLVEWFKRGTKNRDLLHKGCACCWIQGRERQLLLTFSNSVRSMYDFVTLKSGYAGDLLWVILNLDGN